MNPAGYDGERRNEKCKNKGVKERLMLHEPSFARDSVGINPGKGEER